MLFKEFVEKTCGYIRRRCVNITVFVLRMHRKSYSNESRFSVVFSLKVWSKLLVDDFCRLHTQTEVKIFLDNHLDFCHRKAL
jgi:hypothetical protein